jgi:3-deoxy-alpha-D-manno-octulosonate 8-oxidase
MIKAPATLTEYTKLKPFWETPVTSHVTLSADGIGDLFKKLAEAGKKRPFFVIDKALRDQPPFGRVFEQQGKFEFNATESEPRTGDVDKLREHLRSLAQMPDVIIGIGGGATMDLSKATAICMANPLRAQDYQGYGLDMNKGLDIWVVPALNGTGAEVTPIAVLRGPEKKLGINNPYTESDVAIVDPQLAAGAPKFNRFFTMMDCYFHHYEITKSLTSSQASLNDAHTGVALAREVLSQDLSEYELGRGIKSAMASILGGTSSVGGRVGAPHAISYGLSNCAPHLPHSVAVTISMLALENMYPDGYADTVKFLEISKMPHPKASDYGIGAKDMPKLVKTAMGMDKIWQSCFGLDDWKKKATPEFMEAIYERIVK